MPDLLGPLASLASVAVRRLRRGPLHPRWTLTYEAVNDYLRRFFVRTSRLPWPEQRKAWASLARPEPVVYRRVWMEKAAVAGVAGEWIVPPDADRGAPLLVHLHGGGWAHGCVDSHRPLLCRLALATGARLFAPEYRLAPEHPFPAALQDAVAVVRGLRASGEGRLAISGDSAGGNLAAATLLALRDAGDPLPVACVLLSPVVDLEASGGSIDANARYDWYPPQSLPFHAGVYLAGHPRTDPLASPIRGVLAGLPPMLVQVGGAEMLLDQCRAFVEKARAAGADATLEVYPGMTHVWQSLAGAIPAFQPAIDSIGRFVRLRAAAASGAARARAAR